MAQLCTTEQVKTALKIPDTTDDAFIGELIDGVSDWIEEYTGRKLTPEASTAYVVDTFDGGRIEVPRGIRSTTFVELATSDQPDTGGTYTTVPAADVLIRPSPINRKPGWPGTFILIRGGANRIGYLNGARITGDFGFAVTPPAIVRVAVDAVSSAYQARRIGASGVIGGDGAASTPWDSYFAWGSPQRQTLMRYRAGANMGIG